MSHVNVVQMGHLKQDGEIDTWGEIRLHPKSWEKRIMDNERGMNGYMERWHLSNEKNKLIQLIEKERKLNTAGCP